VEQYHHAVEQLPERQVQPPTRLPIPRSSQRWVNQFLTRHRGPEVSDVINIDPRGLVIYQFYVAVDRADQHARNIGSDYWTQTCLQIDRPVAQLPIRMEGNIIKVGLPHGEHGLMLRPDGAFQIQQGGGFVCVCEIEGRMVLKAGYHRSFAFVRATMNALEANDTSLLVALTATAPPQLQLPTQGLRTTVLGPRPPFFGDFFSDSLAMKSNSDGRNTNTTSTSNRLTTFNIRSSVKGPKCPRLPVACYPRLPCNSYAIFSIDEICGSHADPRSPTNVYRPTSLLQL
jgi:hypothetical protein